MSDRGGQWNVAHLTASPFFGGPERQMLGLACAMREQCLSTFLCLMEDGKARPFVDQLQRREIPSICLQANHPHLLAAVRETAAYLKQLKAEVLFTHGYKANVIGAAAARFAGIPLVAVSRGWTGATRKVRLYEAVDRLMLRLADRVVCVSQGQARKVLRARVREEKVTVIRNSIDIQRFDRINPDAAQVLRALIPDPVARIVLAAGRLSPEKAFDRLVEAAAQICAYRDDVGFVLVGDGPLKANLRQQIASRGLQRRFILAGFRNDVDDLLPHATCLVQSSYTEGMPNVVLEAMAASVPVVATAVGGTPELVINGETGLLVPPADAPALAEGVATLLGDTTLRSEMGRAGRMRVEEQFTFSSQAGAYLKLLESLASAQRTTPGENPTVVARA